MTAGNEYNEVLPVLLVMGITGVGKSSFINKLAREEVAETSDSVLSCTSRCKGYPVKIGGTRALLIDTPGFDDSRREDSDILTDISNMLVMLREKHFQLHGIIYLHRITDDKYGGAARRTLEMFQDICGEDALKNVKLVTTRWEVIDEELGARRESEISDKIWADMIDKGAGKARYYGETGSAEPLAAQLLIKESVVLDLQREIFEEGKDLVQTAAGSRINRDNEDMRARLELRLADLERQLVEKNQADKTAADLSRQRADLERKRKELDQMVANTLQQQEKLRLNPRNGWERALQMAVPIVDVIAQFIGLEASGMELMNAWFG